MYIICSFCDYLTICRKHLKVKSMAVKIRLKRTGAKNKPCFKIGVMDVKCQRDGKAIEYLGYYNPVSKETKVDIERTEYWHSKGAKLSETVYCLYRKAGGQKIVMVKKYAKAKPVKEPVKSESDQKSDQPQKTE